MSDSACCSSSCCGGEGRPERTVETTTLSGDPRLAVRERYGSIAETRGGCGCGSLDHRESMTTLGYTEEQIAALPEGADLGLGCGNPLAFADVQPGETVLDLGSGAGIDCFLAAPLVGPAGRVIGVDMTAAMIERARANATRYGHPQVEFRLGEIENLPVADGTVNVVISNCVVNLSPDKARAFREAHRALKPGGRMLVSDLVLTRALTPEQSRSVELYVGCVAGAALESEYLDQVRAAGFASVEVVSRSTYGDTAAHEAFGAVQSIKVRALKG